MDAAKRNVCGVIHGRFQVLHHDHLKYLLAGQARSEHLVVGITNPDPRLTQADPADPERSDARANPLTYYERMVMVREALRETGIGLERFSIVPFPINFPELYAYYVPRDAIFYLTIYDAWGRRKLEMFRSLGLKTEVLWERPPEEKGLRATEVRERILRGEPWQHLVPASTRKLIEHWRIQERLLRLRSQEDRRMEAAATVAPVAAREPTKQPAESETPRR